MNITRIIHASLVLIVRVVFLAPLETQAATTIRTATTSSILVGHWPFDEATSTRIGDFSRSGNHGTLIGFSFPATASSGWTSLGKRGGGNRAGGASSSGGKSCVVFVSTAITSALVDFDSPACAELIGLSNSNHERSFCCCGVSNA